MTLFIDTETTGLLVPNELNPDKQPRIVEIAAIKTDDALRELDRFSVLINPGVPLPPESKDWYDITDEMLADAKSFPFVLKTHILPFWRGEETVVAYNVEFDLGMMLWELRRIGWEHRFPYCWDVVDAIQYRQVNGKQKRISLETWSKEALGAEFVPQTHRAMDDVERLLACYRTLGTTGG